MDVYSLSPNKKKTFYDVENNLRERHLKIVKSMSVTELRKFNKHIYKETLILEMKELVGPIVSEGIIKESCHYISNALNNESQSENARRKQTSHKPREYITRQSKNNPQAQPETEVNDTEKDIVEKQLDSVVILSDSMQEMFITQHEPETEQEDFHASDTSCLLDESAFDASSNDEVEVRHLVDECMANIPVMPDTINTKNMSNATESADSLDDSITTVKERIDVSTKCQENKPKKTKMTKTKKNTKMSNQVDCVCSGKISGDTIRCCLCQLWFHENCMNIAKSDQIGFWTCTVCRDLPKMIKQISEQLSAIMKANSDLVRDFSAKVVQIHDLKSENERLRQMVRKSDDRNDHVERGVKTTHVTQENNHAEDRRVRTSEPPKPEILDSFGTLVAGSSIIRDISRETHFLEFDPICVRGGKINHISECLLQMPRFSKKKAIILQVGSNDCTDDSFDPKLFHEDYSTLVSIASSLSDSVVVSGMCPRLDDKHGNITKGNACMQKIANDENCLFVDNDSLFRLKNGSIDMSLYNRDGVHLNAKGVSKLASHLEITQKDSGDTGSYLGDKRGKSYSYPTTKKSNQMNTNSNMKYGEGSPVRRETNKRQFNKQGNHYHHSQGSRNYGDNYSNSDGIYCWFCGESNHTSSVCRHGDIIQCRKCNGYGHKAKVCNFMY